MTTALKQQKVDTFMSAVNAPQRIGVSEFARSKNWRTELPHVGCFEMVDRNGLVGYLLDPSYAEALNARILELEEELEQATLAAIFATRTEENEYTTGNDLLEKARSYFDSHEDEIKEAIYGN
jgi:hypothetical protein